MRMEQALGLALAARVFQLDLELAAVLLFRVHAPALRINTGTL